MPSTPTPYAEWRAHCVRTGGNPMSMCSYFVYDRFPTFMTAWFIILHSVDLIVIALRFHDVFRIARSWIRCCRAEKKSLLHPRDMETSK